MCPCSEVIDAMFQPSRYDNVYPFSYMYTYLVSVPHSILIQLANPTANKAYGVYMTTVSCLLTVSALLQRIETLKCPVCNLDMP